MQVLHPGNSGLNVVQMFRRSAVDLSQGAIDKVWRSFRHSVSRNLVISISARLAEGIEKHGGRFRNGNKQI